MRKSEITVLTDRYALDPYERLHCQTFARNVYEQRCCRRKWIGVVLVGYDNYIPVKQKKKKNIIFYWFTTDVLKKYIHSNDSIAIELWADR